ncbi:MAG: hypothetical protein ACRD68_15805 [Pyrinomonadaceae bacterium]
MKKILCLSLSFLFTACVGNVIGGSAQSGRVPAEMVGSWRTGRVSMLQYRDRVTGSTTPGNGSTFSYRFYPDGRFEFVGYMQSTMYNCTTSLFNHKTGSVRFEGTEFTLVPRTNNWKKENSCAPRSNSEKAGEMKNDTYSWRVKTEDGVESLCLTQAGGEERCFRKEEE